MLTPEQISALQELATRIADPINDYLLSDIARRIAEAGEMTSTADYQIYIAQKLGQKELKKALQKLLSASEQEIDAILSQSAELCSDATPLADNGTLQQLLTATQKLCNEEMQNYTQTLGMVDPYGRALPLQKVYRSCCDFAFTQVSTGAADYNTAIRNATRRLAEQGVRVIDYESGVHTSLEAAVRRSVMGGIGLMQEQVAQQNYETLGCNGWEISAHGNSAPDHEPFQGRQYDNATYQTLNNSLIRRISTLNCGHIAFPIILGVNKPQYTDEQLEQLRRENANGVTVGGKHYTGYEATQKQRAMERSIRRQKNRILVDEATGDAEKLQLDQIKLRQLRRGYNAFSEEAGLITQNERLNVAKKGT